MTQEQKNSYLKELGRRLNYLGFQTENQNSDILAVAKSGRHLCEISESGGIRFRAEDLTKEEEELVRGTVKTEAATTLEYMKLMAEAPEMKTGDGISHYKLLADFNGVVLAGHETSLGVQFVTWDWDHDRNGVHWGHYYGQNYECAKQDFATRSGLIPQSRLFSLDQMTEIYRCIHETMEADYPITDSRRKLLESAADQIEQNVYNLEERVNQSNQAELELGGGYDVQHSGMIQQF